MNRAYPPMTILGPDGSMLSSMGRRIHHHIHHHPAICMDLPKAPPSTSFTIDMMAKSMNVGFDHAINGSDMVYTHTFTPKPAITRDGSTAAWFQKLLDDISIKVLAVDWADDDVDYVVSWSDFAVDNLGRDRKVNDDGLSPEPLSYSDYLQQERDATRAHRHRFMGTNPEDDAV